ncbi:mixed lineage kinase domain-like protein [Fundulus heteroclitus]|uniref:mixed lineage kinase domain-like protein n=1 Tax=Fundulus heteroclitus TaxID=8078 RepID=UPI00165C836A|nr:mixed lineage kinase domain-like protein [Fundulus heteroclitus]
MAIGSITKSIVSIASEIYKVVQKVKINKKTCERLRDRVKALEGLVSSIESMEAAQHSAEVKKSLEELNTTLNSAFKVMEIFTRTHWFKSLIKIRSYEEDFKLVNDRLHDNMQNLTTALELKQTHDIVELVKQAFRQRDDEEDRKEDAKELKRMLLEYRDYVEAMQSDLEDVKNNLAEVMETLDKPKIIMDICPIQESELCIPDFPNEGDETDQALQVYKGQFKGFEVAVKIFASLNVPPEKIKSEFQKEVQTMKQFESPNIVRMFGICILNEKTPNPKYLIVMEYCEKGSLQEVLSSRCDLSWTRKVSMCRDAAQGVYRLHQTERNSKLHTNISSNKFLVDQNYGVKLGGLELAQTETSMKKAAVNRRKDKDFISLLYSSPQELDSISHYCRKCDIYSLGIVMWEIATRRMPFSDCHGDKDSLHKKVVAEKYREPLPQECPETLAELINSCRAYECIQRPSAGELVDKLRYLLIELEQQ